MTKKNLSLSHEGRSPLAHSVVRVLLLVLTMLSAKSSIRKQKPDMTVNEISIVYRFQHEMSRRL